MNVRDIFLPEYQKYVQNFIDFVWHKADSASWIKCTYKRYANMVYHHIILIEEYLLRYGMDQKNTNWIWHGEGDPNEVVCDDDDIEDDSDVAEPIEYSGIGELLDYLHQGVCSNVCMSTSASEGNSDH